MAFIFSMPRSFFLSVVAVLVMSIGLASCSRHHAQAAAAAAPVAPVQEKVAEPIATLPTVSKDTTSRSGLRDSVIGSWRLRSMELVPVGTDGAQQDAAEMAAKQKQFQDVLKGLVMAFNADETYVITYGSTKDTGTWRVTRRRELDTFSKNDFSPASYQVRSITASTLIMMLDGNDLKVLLTMDKL